ncbi:MAG: hypothetical protein JWO60_2027 [Frankiales bacterium]|nr:hypothetical protein [Frankiales bacterium]
MTELAPLRAHVLRSLRKDLCTGPLGLDEDGDVRIVWETLAVYVRLLPGTPPLVRVWAPAASGLPGHAKVLRELNDVNAGLVGARSFLRGGTLYVAGELEVESVEPGELGRLVERVGTTAVRVGSMLVAVHGGSPPFVEQDAPQLEDSEGAGH